MAKPLQSLFLISFLFVISFLFLVTKVHSSKDATSFAFDSFKPNPKRLTYQGGAWVPSDSSGVLRLTKTEEHGPVPYWVGRVLYSDPVHFSDKSSGSVAAFQTSIRFQITSKFNLSNDGIAFFIAPVNTTIPDFSSSGSLGIYNFFGEASQVFGVEFDSYSDVWDPPYNHIGIDIESRESVAYTKFDSATGTVVTAFINYEPSTGLITVAAISGSQYAAVTYTTDLSKILPEFVQVGISSSTGFVTTVGVSDIHSWYFTSVLAPVGSKDENKYIQKYAPV